MNTEVLLSLLRGLFTSSQDLARDEMGAEIVGAGRLCGRDDGGVGGIDCNCCGGACRCCGATVIFVDSGAQPEVYLLVWWGIAMGLEFSLDRITMTDSGDFLCPQTPMFSFSDPHVISPQWRGREKAMH